jgi:hypothetical protein
VMGTFKNNTLKVQISCQNNNQNLVGADYIYPISYKIAKKDKPPDKGFALFEKTISQKFKASDIYGVKADVRKV